MTPSEILVLMIVVALGLILIIMAGFYRKEKDKVAEYKTCIWLAMGKVKQGKSPDDIFKTIECYMPECDKAHFRDNYGEIECQ